MKVLIGMQQNGTAIYLDVGEPITTRVFMLAGATNLRIVAAFTIAFVSNSLS